MPRKTLKTIKVGHNFRMSLRANDVTQSTMAAMLAISPSAVCTWTKSGVSQKNAAKVAKLLHVKAESICSRVKTAKVRPSLTVLKPQVPSKRETRTINITLLELIAEKRLSKIQETLILSIANNFLEEHAA